MNGQTAYRKGEYFRKELPINNTSALSTNITVAATGQSSVTGSMLLAKASESFWPDADGNLLSDSLWTNKWNAENRMIQVESALGVPAQVRMHETWTHLPDGSNRSVHSIPTIFGSGQVLIRLKSRLGVRTKYFQSGQFCPLTSPNDSGHLNSK